jgi:hypothetical protein
MVLSQVNDETWAAIAMRCLDESERDRLIDGAGDKVLDARNYLSGVASMARK